MRNAITVIDAQLLRCLIMGVPVMRAAMATLTRGWYMYGTACMVSKR